MAQSTTQMVNDDRHAGAANIRERLHDTIALAMRLMAGRKDWQGRDYYLHDIEVMELLPPDASDAERKAALLHSTLDGGAATYEELLRYGVDPEVADIVKLVSNGPTVKGYAAYVQKCRDVVATGNRAAMRVKLADMVANAGHPTNNYAETIEIMRAGLRALRP